MTIRNSVASAVSLLVGCGTAAFAFVGTASADDSFLKPGSLVISSSTYEDVGQVAALNVESGAQQLPADGSSGYLSGVPSSTGNYVTVWNNANNDGSFGVSSPIFLTAVEPSSGRELGRLAVPEEQVVTSFSSKSELSLHYSRDERGGHLVFAGYGGVGVGVLDASNSDAVPNQDPTNPVTVWEPGFHAPRTIVSLDDFGHFSYTPTQNYGGNNGRSALLAPNGLYYTVGNSNNGSADAFGSASNGTNPDVTTTTGVEVVQPINSWSATELIAAKKYATSAEVNPTLQFGYDKGSNDKAGKDNNFRGLTEYKGALYFTKGSGSNGSNTVYTIIDSSQYPQYLTGYQPVSYKSTALTYSNSETGGTSGLSPVPEPLAGNVLPTIADATGPNANNLAIRILNGFPDDPARKAGNFSPFALFFANDTTLYVTDEGDGGVNSTNTNPQDNIPQNAGLQKWSLVNGVWKLDYVLQQGLIGTTNSNLRDRNGQNPYPTVTTFGLRNLAGRVNRDGTVTLWATTATGSTSGDTGADPNEVVEITDSLAATTVTPAVASETFSIVKPAVYGNVYRGVAYIPGDDDHGHGFGDDFGHDHR